MDFTTACVASDVQNKNEPPPMPTPPPPQREQNPLSLNSTPGVSSPHSSNIHINQGLACIAA